MGSALTKVVSGVYLGGIDVENDCNAMVQFTHVLTIISNDSNPNLIINNSFERKLIIIDEHDPMSLLKIFPEAIAFITQARVKNASILIDSHAGSLTGIAVVIAYLVTEFNALNVGQAILLMHHKFPDFILDDWTHSQLERYETADHNEQSFSKSLPSLCEQRLIFSSVLQQQTNDDLLSISNEDWCIIKELLSLIEKENSFHNISICSRRTNTKSTTSNNSVIANLTKSHQLSPSLHGTNFNNLSLGCEQIDSFSNETGLSNALENDMARRLEINDLFSADPNAFLEPACHHRLSERDSTEELMTDEDTNADLDDKNVTTESDVEVPGSIDIPQHRKLSSCGIKNAIHMASVSYMSTRGRQISPLNTTVERGMDATTLTYDSSQYSKTAPVEHHFFQ